PHRRTPPAPGGAFHRGPGDGERAHRTGHPALHPGDARGTAAPPRQPAGCAGGRGGPPTWPGAPRPADLRAVVDGAALAPGTYRIRPQVEVPSGVRVGALRPPAIVRTGRRRS